ncbi:hypothetical protein Q7M94_03610 [Candidatus Liberibacter asiaticus]|uniref:hypothetical protein n=1 Tax=Liberibacter asiaticus TaxID=34021 RepID=UPI00234B83EB|nr:hypothetical protein [Candidatus Liberibacter asiaticus]WCM58114.1 hypothetical protein NLY32_03605 [Candidatus Liberibacter asiaticus]
MFLRSACRNLLVCILSIQCLVLFCSEIFAFEKYKAPSYPTTVALNVLSPLAPLGDGCEQLVGATVHSEGKKRSHDVPSSSNQEDQKGSPSPKKTKNILELFPLPLPPTQYYSF